MEVLLAKYGSFGTIGAGVVMIVLLLVKEVIANRNGEGSKGKDISELKALILSRMAQVDKDVERACPVADAGGTPMTKEQHDELCVSKMEVLDGKFERLGEKIDGVKANITKIYDRLERGPS